MSESSEAPPAPPEQEPEDVGQDEDDSPNTLARLGLVRIAVGGLGLGGFILGAVVAWRSTSATTLLIVSAILLLLAALGLDWEEIRGTYGSATFQLLRRGWQNVEQQIERVAAHEEIPPGIREELESLREQVKALTPPRRPRPGRSAPAPNMDALVRELMRTHATHSFEIDGAAVTLSLRTPASDDARYRCTVKTPTGGAFNALARRVEGITTFGPKTFLAVYPNEFEGSEPLVPGRYEVEWRSAPLVDPVGRNLLAEQLVRIAAPPFATDSFTIPETRRAEAPAE